MGLYDQYETSEKLEKQGRWLDFGPAEEDGKKIRVRIARAGGMNSSFKRMMESRSRPHRRAMEKGRMDPDTLTRIMIEVLAETVILAWENVVDKEGKKMTCNKENKIKIMTDLPDFYAEILEYATKGDTFSMASVEEDTKN